MEIKHDQILQELIDYQRKKVFKIAADLGVKVSAEDILNPHDFPALHASAQFNYEDGLLAGLLSAQMALRRK